MKKLIGLLVLLVVCFLFPLQLVAVPMIGIQEFAYFSRK